jgi:SAM-dependent methyltransferase
MAPITGEVAVGGDVEKDQDAAVRTLYERFPYPSPIDDVAAYVAHERNLFWNPRQSWNVFFPQAPQRADLDILVAGCGTRAGFLVAASMPQSRVTCIDISETSLAHSRDSFARGGLANVEHHLLPLEEVGALDRAFDFIHCHGVLHHLAQPEAGLGALAGVLRPGGAMSLMVYARYGRRGIYMLQDLGQRLGLEPNQEVAEELRELCWALPASHPFRATGYEEKQTIELNEVIDMLAHPRDVSYDVDGVRGLVASAGLKLHRWLDQAQYSSRVGEIRKTAVGARAASLPFWDRSAAMELLRGTVIKHSFVVTHPHRPSADELFADEEILGAVPSKAAHVSVTLSGSQAVALSRALPAHHGSELGVAEEAVVFKEIFGTFDGERTLGEILEGQLERGADPALETWLPSFCRQLYEADILDLRLPSAASTQGSNSAPREGPTP